MPPPNELDGYLSFCVATAVRNGGFTSVASTGTILRWTHVRAREYFAAHFNYSQTDQLAPFRGSEALCAAG